MPASLKGPVNPAFRHGRTKTPEWYIWRAMRGRCRDPNVPNFERYGGRGIKVCERWDKGEDGQSGFACFIADVGQRPNSRHSIDRINNDGDYEPSNVRWATLEQQTLNRRQHWSVEMPQLPVPVPTDQDEARALIAHFIEASRSKNTRQGYAKDWDAFFSYCSACGRLPLPAEPETIAAYCAVLATSGLKYATIKRRCAAIAFVHRSAGHSNPVAHVGVSTTLDGIARELGSAPKKKAALTADLIGKAVRKIPTDVLGRRDRALLLLGFAAALRRSELVALDVLDVARHPKGALITLRKSKTDQAGKGLTKAVPHGKKLDAVAALDAWLIAARITDGPIFRAVRGDLVKPNRLSDKQVARIVKKRCAAAGLDAKLFSGHSLRSGFLTSASDAGASLQAMAKHAGHSKVETTVGYIQVADAFKDHPGKGFL